MAGAWRAAAGSKGPGFDMGVGAGLLRSVVLDPLRLNQTLNNLLSTACQHTAPAGSGLTCCWTPPAGCCVGWVTPGWPSRPATRRVCLCRSPPRPARSGPARRGAAEGGSGLGLAICHQLAGLMGARTPPDSVLGQHTCISMDNPLARDASMAPPGSRRGKVQVCDDGQVSRLITTEMQRRSGFQAVEAGDGQHALAI